MNSTLPVSTSSPAQRWSKLKIVGWVLTVLIVIFLAGLSASGKFTEWDGKDEMFAKFGFTNELMMKIGILEVILAFMLLIPRAAFIGAILLTGYLGGATVTHLRVGDEFWLPPVLGVVMWIALGLRRPEIFKLALGEPVVKGTET